MQLVVWLVVGCWLVVVADGWSSGGGRRLVGRGHRTSVSRRPFDPTLANKFRLSELRWTVDNLRGSKQTFFVIDLLFKITSQAGKGLSFADPLIQHIMNIFVSGSSIGNVKYPHQLVKATIF